MQSTVPVVDKPVWFPLQSVFRRAQLLVSVGTFLCNRTIPFVPVKCQKCVLHTPWLRPFPKSQCQDGSLTNPPQPSDGKFGYSSCRAKAKLSCSESRARHREPLCPNALCVYPFSVVVVLVPVQTADVCFVFQSWGCKINVPHTDEVGQSWKHHPAPSLYPSCPVFNGEAATSPRLFLCLQEISLPPFSEL